MKFLSPVIFLIPALCLFFFLNGYAQVQSPPPAPSFKLFLIGDAGEGDTSGATLHDLGRLLTDNPNSAVVFLGDNCYINSFFGLVKLEAGGYDGSKKAKGRIMSQLNILKGYQGSAYFIPGNHDWFNHINLRQGKKRLLAEQKFIEDTLRKYTSIINHEEGTFLPVEGSPGPISREFNEGKTRIIFIDSYRLIIEEGRKKRADSLMLAAFYAELKVQLTEGAKKHQKIIVVAHHPIHAKGKHSFPLVFWERLMRRFADSNTNYPPYNRMSNRLDSALKAFHHPDIYFVSGHEHSLEYFFNDSLHYIISGAGSRIDNLKLESCQDNEECLKWNEQGFYEIDFYGRYEKVLMYHRLDEKSKLEVTCITGCN